MRHLAPESYFRFRNNSRMRASVLSLLALGHLGGVAADTIIRTGGDGNTCVSQLDQQSYGVIAPKVMIISMVRNCPLVEGIASSVCSY